MAGEARRVDLAGALADQDRAPQSAAPPASNTRDSNAPEAAYGLTCSQSTDSAAPAASKSLASGRISAEMVAAWEATSVPSMK